MLLACGRFVLCPVVEYHENENGACVPLILFLQRLLVQGVGAEAALCVDSGLCRRHLLAVGLSDLEGVVYLDDQDRKMIVTRAGGMRPLLLADCHVPPDQRFTFYDQVHTTGARASCVACLRFGTQTTSS